MLKENIDLNGLCLIYGPSASGKSTLAKALMGHPSYTITKGKVIMDGVDVTSMDASLRSKAGLFLSFQSPVKIVGVKINNFIRAAVNARREEPFSPIAFHALLKAKMNELNMDSSFTRRYVNDGLSGGEQKKAEILQMAMLEPKYALLDETDSGLDVDALRIVATHVNKLKKDMAVILITHYQRFLDHISPDEVVIIKKGEIVKTGSADLALEIEKKGFEVVE